MKTVLRKNIEEAQSDFTEVRNAAVVHEGEWAMFKRMAVL